MKKAFPSGGKIPRDPRNVFLSIPIIPSNISFFFREETTLMSQPVFYPPLDPSPSCFFWVQWEKGRFFFFLTFFPELG